MEKYQITSLSRSKWSRNQPYQRLETAGLNLTGSDFLCQGECMRLCSKKIPIEWPCKLINILKTVESEAVYKKANEILFTNMMKTNQSRMRLSFNKPISIWITRKVDIELEISESLYHKVSSEKNPKPRQQHNSTRTEFSDSIAHHTLWDTKNAELVARESIFKRIIGF